MEFLWVLGSGAAWRELPNRYPPYQTCHRRFQQWVREGNLERILRVLAEELQAKGKLERGDFYRRLRLGCMQVLFRYLPD
jgi:transposase